MEAITPGEAGVENGGGASAAMRFVTDALFPFLLRCQRLKQPGVAEVGALLWGYQVGAVSEVSPLDVADAIRTTIAAAERSDDKGLSGIVGLIDSLHLVEAAMPRVATGFWYRPPLNQE